jgi:hypothetical protein
MYDLTRFIETPKQNLCSLVRNIKRQQLKRCLIIIFEVDFPIPVKALEIGLWEHKMIINNITVLNSPARPRPRSPLPRYARAHHTRQVSTMSSTPPQLIVDAIGARINKLAFSLNQEWISKDVWMAVKTATDDNLENLTRAGKLALATCYFDYMTGHNPSSRAYDVRSCSFILKNAKGLIRGS